ncbi:hypothetical protein [Croceiramulus getboli]|nr:hypothetical protein P8624_00060 [Flavobacteriaceae bacterium YJPT1-3]
MKYTQYRKDGKIIVLQGHKWVNVESFPITDDLKENGQDFYENLRSKEFYHYKNIDTTNPDAPVITTLHGPYLIQDLSVHDYVQINYKKAVKLFKETLKNPLFLDEQMLDLSFRFEANKLFESSLKNYKRIYWLDKAFTINDRFNSPYNFWAEFIIIEEINLKLVTIAED